MHVLLLGILDMMDQGQSNNSWFTSWINMMIKLSYYVAKNPYFLASSPRKAFLALANLERPTPRSCKNAVRQTAIPDTGQFWILVEFHFLCQTSLLWTTWLSRIWSSTSWSCCWNQSCWIHHLQLLGRHLLASSIALSDLSLKSYCMILYYLLFYDILCIKIQWWTRAK